MVVSLRNAATIAEGGTIFGRCGARDGCFDGEDVEYGGLGSRMVETVKDLEDEQVLESEMRGERSRDRAKHGPEDRWEPSIRMPSARVVQARVG